MSENVVNADVMAIIGNLASLDFWYLVMDRFRYYFDMGGWVMPPLVLSLVLLWYGLGYRMAALRRPGKGDVRWWLEQYFDGRWQRKPRGIVQHAMVKGVAIWRDHRIDLRRLLDDAFGEYDTELKRHLILVRTIIAVAPLMGLLGTVTGMIETFDSLQQQVLFSQSGGGIAGGISQALLTTQLGLAVAIPGLIVEGFLERRQQNIELELDQIKDILCSTPAQPRQPDSGLEDQLT